MQIATRGRRTIVGMTIGLTLLGLGIGPALGEASGRPWARQAPRQRPKSPKLPRPSHTWTGWWDSACG